MKSKLIYLLIFIAATLAKVQAQEVLTIDSLVKLVKENQKTKNIGRSMKIIESEGRRKEKDTIPQLDSAAAIVINDYAAKGFWMYQAPLHYNTTLCGVLKQNYGVNFYTGDTLAYPDFSYKYWYNACMEVFLRQQYGWNVMQKAFIQMQKIDGSGKGNRTAMFPGGYDAMEKYIYCRLNYFDMDTSQYEFPYYDVLFYLNAKGGIDSVSVETYIDETLDADSLAKMKKYEKEIRRVLKKMPAFIPATENGNTIPDEFHFGLAFTPRMREQQGCK